ncbi:sulfotransferase domain-containing protein [Vibrio agarivorans]|uniref:Sulfotransferase domain-containing protein n=1 Tax=Vibrio agarivorans TaxID=153622 RepID=A0ABT7Y3I6_9VIBR|nr:sulfotransferase domain-containing protein [Vibrio agarivorans]MDN2482552.1 sulfotransferase domain-containing protein [Vibrio agarivorans]
MIELTSRNLFCKTSYVIDQIVAKTQKVQPVLITGYWRSGTTWVQNVLAAGIGAKTLFEPLEPNTLLPLYNGRIKEVAPYVPLSFDVLSKDDLRFLDLAFAGISPKYQQFNYLSRVNLQEAFRHNVVVKLVRGQYISGDLKERYNLSNVLHVSRHPMAVTYSMLRTDWEWSIHEADFAQLYAKEHDMPLPDDKQAILDTLLRFNNQPPECKIAATWALAEKYTEEQSHTRVFRYEDLVTHPERQFQAMAQQIGHALTLPNNISAASVVTAKDRTHIDTESRLHSWRDKLDSQKQSNIRSVLRELWPDIEQHWEL